MDTVYQKDVNNSVADALSRYFLQNSEPGVSFQAISESWLENRYDQLCQPFIRHIGRLRLGSIFFGNGRFPISLHYFGSISILRTVLKLSQVSEGKL